MKKLMSLVMLFTFVSCASFTQKNHKQIAGVDHFNNKVEINTKEKKSTVVVFLSSICPCSNSHVKLLKTMNEDFKNKDVQFVGIHSNYNEDLNKAQYYFAKSKLGFPIIYDKETTLAKKLGGVKTPHVFVLNQKGDVVYTGSVTNSNNALKAKENYLLQALTEMEEGKPITISKRKTLGCYIPLKD
jgi:thioredoxin-related protein